MYFTPVRQLATGLVLASCLFLLGQAQALTPSVTNGLITQLDGSDVTLDVGGVASWNDQSGQANHALQVTEANRPTLLSSATPTGADALGFDGAAQYIDIAANAADYDAAAVTWFVVFRPNASPDNRRMISGAYSDIDPSAGVVFQSQAWASITHLTGTGYRTLTRTATGGFLAAGAGPLTDTDYHIGISVVDTDTDEFFARMVSGDGAIVDSGISTGADLQLVGHQLTRIGGQSAAGNLTVTSYWGGDIAAILIYNRRLTDNEITSVTSEMFGEYMAHPGDANGDGMVNLADLQILGDNWQSATANWGTADFTWDGLVNLADLQIIGDNWGYGTGPDLSFDEAVERVGIVIPEPTTIALLGLTLPLLLRRRTNR
ncbi:MAG: hypothetical protein IT445_19320 [Phycisphaeraceae bacterium]|nr:hypothetical protein [Phycisphaeraceae bacterium]